ncbi:hypothetical protein [Mucilaginibacter paludis]|uniref:Uncharacterized protein n=1 Tax=Mucilaginibacter paludis DSM 18603 TaxID=714943 RepID=H1YAY0_9SPHI|nr:hypothetical protein [Mucilaginibacter paludis]EHQ30013.1 hypothetical protein Mucpa_5953 [Mucilaginibacter paludis DSM 18603]
MSIISKVLSALAHLPSALFNVIKSLGHSIQSQWDNLPKAEQDAVINGSKVGELLKQFYKDGEAVVLQKVTEATGLSPDIATAAILAVGKDLGINATTVQQVLDHIGSKVDELLTDTGWNGLWSNIAKSLAGWLSTGSLDWVSLSMGLMEWAYRAFVKA